MSEKKTYRLVGVAGGLKIEWNGGGEIPHALKGVWTSPKRAEHAIDVYETQARSSNKRKVKAGGKTKDDSRAA